MLKFDAVLPSPALTAETKDHSAQFIKITKGRIFMQANAKMVEELNQLDAEIETMLA